MEGAGMTRYTYATTLSWGGDEPTAEVEVEVSFSIAWGRPAQISGPPEQCYPGEADMMDGAGLGGNGLDCAQP